MKTENVLSALKTLGFKPEPIGEYGYKFDYEGMTLVFQSDDEQEDSDCFTLLMPDIFDISADNRQEVVEAMVRLCGKMKYVQPSIMFEDQVWLSYNHYLGEQELTPEIIEHMVHVLDVATYRFHKIINGEENEN